MVPALLVHFGVLVELGVESPLTDRIVDPRNLRKNRVSEKVPGISYKWLDQLHRSTESKKENVRRF